MLDNKLDFEPCVDVFSVNLPLSYLEKQKFKFSSYKDSSKTIFLDNELLSALEASAKKDYKYKEECEYIKNKIKFTWL